MDMWVLKEQVSCWMYLAYNPHTSVCGKHVEHRLQHLQWCPGILVLILLQARTTSLLVAADNAIVTPCNPPLTQGIFDSNSLYKHCEVVCMARRAET